MGTKSLGHVIGNANLGIGKDLDPALVVIGHKRQKEQAHHVLPKIRRDVADFQTPVRVRIVMVRLEELVQRFGVKLVPAAMFVGDRPGVVSSVEVQGVTRPLSGSADWGGKPNRMPIGADGVIEQALVFERIAEVVVCLGQVGVQSKWASDRPGRSAIARR
jgi:hypothetical protein